MAVNQYEKCIIFSAPSGAGKTTIVHRLLKQFDELSFSVSACSRAPRGTEINGVDYHFLSVDEFKKEIEQQAFIEWEEVYTDHFYGTLKREIDRIWSLGKVVIFDVDVYGGINLKKYFGDKALSFFIEPPTVHVLEERLRKRSTETEDRIQLRLSKAKEELELKEQFDISVVNDKLDPTVAFIAQKVREFIHR